MNEAIALIREKLAKAEIKVARAEKAWESAKNEAADLQTTLRVMSELTGESVPAPTSSASVADRQLSIVNLLSVGEPAARAPVDIYDAYRLIADEDISIDTFRTTIWRMKDGAFQVGPDLWLVKGDNGRYWKVPGTFGTRNRHRESFASDAPKPKNVFPVPDNSGFDEDHPF